MGNLLRYEGRKLRHNAAFYIMLAIGIVLVAFTVSLTHFFSKDVESDGASQALSGMSNGMFSIVAGLFVSIFVCEDYGNGAIKNIYGRGYSKPQIYGSKFLVSLLAVLLFAIADVLVGFLLGYAYWGKAGSFDSKSWAILLTMVLSVGAYHALFFMVSMLVRKMAGALSINIVTPMAMSLILVAIDSAWSKKSFNLGDYWISGVLGNATSGGGDESLLYWGLLILAIYIAVFFVAGYLPNRKRDLK